MRNKKVAGHRTWEILFKVNTYFLYLLKCWVAPKCKSQVRLTAGKKKEIDRQIFERFNMQKNRRTDRHIRDSIGKKTQTK